MARPLPTLTEAICTGVHTAERSNLVTLSTSVANSAGDHNLVAFAEGELRTAARLRGGPQGGEKSTGEIRGVRVATCHCPIGELFDGKAVEPSTAFGTQAGQGDTQICFDHPVGGLLPSAP